MPGPPSAVDEAAVVGNCSSREGGVPRWPPTLLSQHAIHSHDDEWDDGGCCALRSKLHAPPEADATLKPLSLRLLFVIVADARNETMALAVANLGAISVVREIASEVIVLSHDDQCSKWATVAEAAALLRVPFRCVECPRATPLPPGHDPFRPKLPLQLHAMRSYLHAQAQPRLPDAFDAVWLADADVGLTADGLSAFLIRWACSFRAGPPLVAQPAMHGNQGRTERAQTFWPLNYAREWRPEGRVGSLGALALHVGYVEQQAPLLDAGFLAWYVAELGQTLAAMQLAAGTDLATDQMWCRAAAAYARRIQGAAAKARPGCAIITVPFRHHNRATIAQSKQFWSGSHRVRVAAAERWPQYWMDPKLLSLYKLGSWHVEEKLGLWHDRCMVRRFASRRLGPACPADRSRGGGGGGRHRAPPWKPGAR